MADISNIVSVALIPEGKAVAKDNMNIVACFTAEMGNALSSAKRTSLYKNLSSVADDFGTYSKIYEYAKVFFAQTPNAVQFGGYLVAAYWRGATETVSAKSGKVVGGQISETTLVDALRPISTGSFVVSVDGTAKTLTGLDFRTISNMADIIAVINASLVVAVCSYADNRITITSSTTGTTSIVTLLTAHTTGVFVGDMLLLSSGSGAIATAGAASTTLTAETKESALNEAIKETYFASFGFIDAPSDSDRTAISTWAKANSKIGLDVVTGSTAFEKQTTNIVWSNVLASGTNYRFIHSKSNDRKKWIAYASRAQSVNFSAENSANTMQLKTLNGVDAEAYTDAEVAKAYAVGMDIYTTIKDVPAVLTSPTNDFFDNVFNLIAYINAVQTDAFNLLKTTGTKIAQTKRGVDTIVSTVEKTTRGFVRNGVFAAGTWTLPDFFGEREVFDRNIETNGFYVKAGLLSDQSADERQLRVSPPIQVAVKNAGAIHSADIIINFNI